MYVCMYVCMYNYLFTQETIYKAIFHTFWKKSKNYKSTRYNLIKG